MRPRWRFTIALATTVSAAQVGAAEAELAFVDLRIAVVIPSGAETGATFHTRLGAEFEAGLREVGGGGPRVSALWVDASEAATLLQARRCDAVVVLGGERPLALRRVADRTFAGSLGRAFGFRPAYLLLSGADGARERGLAAAFPGALRALGRAPSAPSASHD